MLRNPVAFSIVLSLLIGAAIIAATGTNPLLAYSEMVRGALTGSGLRNTVSRMIPIVGMALAISIPFRAGVINLGGEGQMVIGGLAGTLAAIYLPFPPVLVIPLALVAGMIAGALWALLAGDRADRTQASDPYLESSPQLPGARSHWLHGSLSVCRPDRDFFIDGAGPRKQPHPQAGALRRRFGQPGPPHPSPGWGGLVQPAHCARLRNTDDRT